MNALPVLLPCAVGDILSVPCRSPLSLTQVGFRAVEAVFITGVYVKGTMHLVNPLFSSVRKVRRCRVDLGAGRKKRGCAVPPGLGMEGAGETTMCVSFVLPPRITAGRKHKPLAPEGKHCRFRTGHSLRTKAGLNFLLGSSGGTVLA